MRIIKLRATGSRAQSAMSPGSWVSLRLPFVFSFVDAGSAATKLEISQSEFLRRALREKAAEILVGGAKARRCWADGPELNESIPGEAE